jgi:hypothetical protein
MPTFHLVVDEAVPVDKFQLRVRVWRQAGLGAHHDGLFDVRLSGRPVADRVQVQPIAAFNVAAFVPG